MKYVVMLLALCAFVLGTHIDAGHKSKYKKIARTGNYIKHYGCATCGH